VVGPAVTRVFFWKTHMVQRRYEGLGSHARLSLGRLLTPLNPEIPIRATERSTLPSLLPPICWSRMVLLGTAIFLDFIVLIGSELPEGVMANLID